MKPVYLLTGRPGTGKTSLIKEAIAGMAGRAGGFYTQEIRDQGVRQGFELVTLDGHRAILAHVDIRSPHRVSKYGVDVAQFDRVGVPALCRAGEQDELVVVDEIGRMELFSSRFRETVLQLINSGKRILGTIMLQADPWADTIKYHPQVHLVTVTRANRTQVYSELLRWLETVAITNNDIPD